MIIVFTILGIIMFIFIFHFISLPIVKRVRKHRNYIKDVLYKSPRFTITMSGSHDLMITRHQYSKMWIEDYTDTKHSHDIMFWIGGLTFTFYYKKDFLEGNVDDRMRAYGLYSVDGESFWNLFWWGNHTYSNPFKPNRIISKTVYDFDNLTPVNKKDIDSTDQMPCFQILTDKPFIDKDGVRQNVHEIKFWLEEMRWTLPILHWLHLDGIYQKSYLFMDFESDTELGVGRHDWKGGVVGGSINITRDYSDIAKLYRKHLKKPTDVELLSRLKEDLDFVIMGFMYGRTY